MMLDGVALALLLAWGTAVGLDLVSVPQAMIARPLVAGTVAGWIAGDLEAGLRVGLLLELFALDVLPVGASRYPDYGPATVGGAAFAAAAGGWESSLGIAAAIAVIVALVGDWSLFRLRHRIARDIQGSAAALAAGDGGAIRALQRRSIGRDAARSLGLTVLALALGFAAYRWLALDIVTARMLSMVAIGCGLAAVVGGAIRSAGRGARVRWLTIGAAAGVALAWLR
jgi:PTS system mannose-specific IIC component